MSYTTTAENVARVRWGARSLPDFVLVCLTLYPVYLASAA